MLFFDPIQEFVKINYMYIDKYVHIETTWVNTFYNNIIRNFLVGNPETFPVRCKKCNWGHPYTINFFQM